MRSNGRFKKGNIPFNKGLKLKDYVSEEALIKIQETQYKPGQTAGDKNNTWKGGVQIPKNDCVHLYAGVNTKVRRPKKVYEDVHGKIPHDWVIYHLDGDKYNDTIDNLIAIPREILMLLCSKNLTNTRKSIEQKIIIYVNRK